jgi:hypothetical protein
MDVHPQMIEDPSNMLAYTLARQPAQDVLTGTTRGEFDCFDACFDKMIREASSWRSCRSP